MKIANKILDPVLYSGEYSGKYSGGSGMTAVAMTAVAMTAVAMAIAVAVWRISGMSQCVATATVVTVVVLQLSSVCPRRSQGRNKLSQYTVQGHAKR
jgi:hypothetical protein